jgi:hypothetical protein
MLSKVLEIVYNEEKQRSEKSKTEKKENGEPKKILNHWKNKSDKILED